MGRSIRAVRSRWAALGLVASVACQHGPPRAPIWFDKISFDSCAELGAGKESGAVPEGHFTLWLTMQADGTIPAAFFHDAAGFVEEDKLRCIAALATGARGNPQATDGIRPLYLSCAVDRRLGTLNPHLRCNGRDNQFVEQPFDAKLARATLSIAEWASTAQRGQADEYAGLHAEAIEQFRRALAKDGDSILALRGLAEALVASGGELTEARASAEKAVKLDGAASATHEALLSVCLAQEDNSCIAREQSEMAGGAGASLRNFSHAALDDRLREASARSVSSADSAGAGKELILAPMQMQLTGLGRARNLNIDLREPAQPPAGAPPIAARIPVVFLPGLGGGLRDFAPQLEHLSAGRRAVVIEAPGIGFSEPPLNNRYELGAILEDINAILDSLSIDRCVLVGHGLGATLAVALARRHKSAGLLLIDPLGDLTKLEPAERKRAEDDLKADELLANFDANVTQLLRGAKPATLRLVVREAHMLRADAAVGYFSLALAEPVAREIRELGLPARIVRSRFDDEPIALAALLKELPAKRVADTSSWLMLDAPEVVNAELDALLETVEKKP